MALLVVEQRLQSGRVEGADAGDQGSRGQVVVVVQRQVALGHPSSSRQVFWIRLPSRRRSTRVWRGAGRAGSPHDDAEGPQPRGAGQRHRGQRGDAGPAAARGGGSRRQRIPEEQAEAILAESEERTLHPDADDAQGGHRRSARTADRSDVRHEHPVQLRWSDPDSYGHVNHARALSLLEDARLAVAAASPSTVPGRQPDIILARLEVDYLRQLYYRVGEVLTVRSWVDAHRDQVGHRPPGADAGRRRPPSAPTASASSSTSPPTPAAR